ncbi:Hydrolase, TatD family [uncultured delta proteobacterium]|uniref:Hydrolase, TatD family n=1 Tax=uncultured delta proteobacterium TaxID=34034 RepID=A0A212JUI3_9DELT|nr:Hydrolase, TatD family [uncultured delta proteobacterium]
MSKHKHGAPAVAPESLHMPLTGADSHAHLDMRHFEDNEVTAVLERAAAAGVASIGNVFLGTTAWETGKARFANHPGVFFLLGIHPTDAMEYTPAEKEAMIRAFAMDSRLRAVGEIGLDFYWKDCPPEVQIPAFIDQLHLARDLKKPVVIHSRDAYDATLKILRDEGFHGYPLLWHCFGGTRDQAQYLVDAGWHISIPGPVTFPANTALREALAVIPKDRLLAETDCPYLAPMPYRGKRNEPAYTVFTVSAMAEALGEDPKELWTRCGNNTRKFFGVA